MSAQTLVSSITFTYIFESIKVSNLIILFVRIGGVDVVSKEERSKVIIRDLLSYLTQVGEQFSKVLLEPIRYITL